MDEKFSVNDAVANVWNKLDGWLEAIILKLPNLAVAILVMVLFYFGGRMVGRFSRKVLFQKIKQESVRIMLGKIVFATMLLIGFFIALGIMELDKLLTSVLAGAGVVGLAIGLALQGTLSNTFSGLALSFLPKIRIGDFIKTGDIEGFVAEITLRNIVLRQPDNDYVIIPNSHFIINPFTNYSWTARSRIDVSCGVAYDTDLEMVEELVVRLIGDNFPHSQSEEVEFFYTEFGDSSINFVVRFWIDCVKSKQKFAGEHKAIKLIRKHFKEEGINIPFPIRTLDFGMNTLETHSKNKISKTKTPVANKTK